MNCPKCGSPVKEGQKFCTKCGTRLSTPVTQPAQQDKGLIDNIRHLGTFIERGSRGVQSEILRDNRRRLEEQAAAMGMEVVKPNGNGVQSNLPEVLTDNHNPHTDAMPVDATSVEGVSIVRGRAIWDIQKGEIARMVTEAEFANTEGLKGIIVQEGCTAVVFIDGLIVSTLNSGCYTFPSKSQAEIQLEQREKEIEEEETQLEKAIAQQEAEHRWIDKEKKNSFSDLGIFGEVEAFGRGILRILFGRKREETHEQHTQRLERTRKKLSAIRSPKVCRVYIVSNRVINLLFGAQTEPDGAIVFAPMVIPTRLFDIKVGVSMQLQITNINLFATNYLSDRKSVSAIDIQKVLSTGVETVIRQSLRNFDYQAEGLPEQIVNNLRDRLQTSCNERLQGIEVTRVIDVTDQSADFDRFRSVEHELFASEKELGFLQRTNEFRNRLEQEQNRRTIDSADNAEQLRESLQKINKDKLLSDDEMEQFVLMLESQKHLREARSKEEEYEALQALKKSRLIKEDDVATLEDTLLQGKIGRENVTEIMRIQAAQKVSMAQIEAKRLLDTYNDERDDLNWNRSFNRRRQEEDYDWQKQQREREVAEQQAQADYNRQRQIKFDEMDILARKAEIARNNMQAMKDAELAAQKEQNRSAENLAAMMHDEQVNRDNIFSNMTAEQIRAAQLSHLTGEAQVAMANSYSHDRENEILRQQAAMEERRRNDDMDRMERMFEKMQSGMLGMAGAQMAAQQQRYDDQVQMKQEYQQQARYAQARQDHTQDQANAVVSDVASAAASNIGAFASGSSAIKQQAPVQPKSAIVCPACGVEIPDGDVYCPECGARV